MDTIKKISSLNSVKRRLSYHRAKGRTIAFTNGCFDILHYGHVQYLERSKRGNCILVVGLNSDRSIKKIKGPQRPINGEKQRAGVLAALKCVDHIVLFNEETPEELIRVLKPNILIKGADWQGKEVVGGDFVRSYGGKVEFVKYLAGYSTSKIIQKIKVKCRK